MSPIEPRDFMLYWAVTIVVLLVVMFRRPRGRGVRLRLLGGARKSRAPAVLDDITPSPAEIRRAAAPPPERRLNVVFQFNGESWDAYEVLGLPAGSNYESVKAAYLESLGTVDAGSRPFVEAAFRAISVGQREP